MAAGIVAAMFMFFSPFSRTVAESGQPQEEPRPQNPIASNVTSTYKQANITVNGFELIADVAETTKQRSKGLAVKDTLSESEGMLFVFPSPSDYQFWMYGMKFPIDIIWLDTNRTVVHIERELEPCDPESCPLYKPDSEALYVLETVAGFADKHGVREGTVVDFDVNALKVK